MSKKIKTTNIKQLISLDNTSKIDSDIYFTINCNDSFCNNYYFTNIY